MDTIHLLKCTIIEMCVCMRARMRACTHVRVYIHIKQGIYLTGIFLKENFILFNNHNLVTDRNKYQVRSLKVHNCKIVFNWFFGCYRESV